MILGIDPGLTNIGICLLDYTSNEIIVANKLSLCNRVSEIKSEFEIIDRVYNLVHSNDFKETYLKKATLILIEVQMRRKMVVVQTAFASILKTMGYTVEFIAPILVKNWFRGKKTIKRMGHKHNKLEAIKVFKSIFPDFIIESSKLDDVCDATLLCLYYSHNRIIYKLK